MLLITPEDRPVSAPLTEPCRLLRKPPSRPLAGPLPEANSRFLGIEHKRPSRPFPPLGQFDGLVRFILGFQRVEAYLSHHRTPSASHDPDQRACRSKGGWIATLGTCLKSCAHTTAIAEHILAAPDTLAAAPAPKLTLPCSPCQRNGILNYHR